MNSFRFSQANLRFIAASLGWVGWLGIGALVIGTAGIAFVAPAIERDNQRQTLAVTADKAQLALLRDPKSSGAGRDPLESLLQVLPADTAVPEFLAAVQRRADAGAVGIDRTEYRVQSVLGHAARRYRLSFPAHVDYPHLRSWVEGLLHDYPSLSLDEISMHRAVDGGEELEAHLGLSFLVREAKR